MDKKKWNAGKKRSSNSDEGIGSSFDSDSSSCGTNGNNLKLLLYSTLLGTDTFKSNGVNIVVWVKNSLEHIWYLIITYIRLCFTFSCLTSSVEAILAS
jgi:hypothetical protein